MNEVMFYVYNIKGTFSHREREFLKYFKSSLLFTIFSVLDSRTQHSIFYYCFRETQYTNKIIFNEIIMLKNNIGILHSKNEKNNNN